VFTQKQYKSGTGREKCSSNARREKKNSRERNKTPTRGKREDGKIIGYARVSSHTQKDDLERQVDAIKRYARERGWEVQILKGTAGLSKNRKNYRKLLELVAKGEVSKVIVTHPDRLTRFGFKTLEFFFQQHGAEIIVLNEKEKTPREELIEDLITIISHFAGKLYGMRSHKYKKLKEGVKKLIEEFENG